MSLIDKLVQMDGSKEELTSNIQRKYSRLIKDENINDFYNLVRQTKVIPILSDEDLKTLYFSGAKDYPSGYCLEQIKDWDEKVHKGKKVAFNSLGDDFKQALQQGYFSLIKNDRVDKENFQRLKEITGVAASEETVNKALEQRIIDMNISEYNFRKVKEATGINPKIDEKVVQEVYTHCLGKDKVYYWEYLFKATGIKPEEKTAQKAFRKMVNENHVYDLIRYSESLGLKPDAKTVKKAYNTLAGTHIVLGNAGSKFTEYYKELKKVSGGIEPDEKTVQAAYRNVVKGRESIWEHYFINIKELTGINPREKFVQQAYARAIKNGDFEAYEKLQGAFKIEPSAEAKKELAKYLSS